MGRLAENPMPFRYGAYDQRKSYSRRQRIKDNNRQREAWFNRASVMPPSPRWWAIFEGKKRQNRGCWSGMKDSQKYRLGFRDFTMYEANQG